MDSSIKNNIPNIVTCFNLLSGCIGIYFAFENRFDLVAYCMIASGIFDFFDGMVARLLRVSSPLGKELDSLADVISFGMLPGVIYFKLLETQEYLSDYLPFFGFIITAFSALRLAKFNLDERQQTDFIGLNTPMNAFYVLSLPFIAERLPTVIYHPAFLFGSILITSYLLVSEFRLFSMKLTSLSWKENKFKYIFLILSAILLITFQFLAIPLILILYLILSYAHFRLSK